MEVSQIGARTRARAALALAATNSASAKRRKIRKRELKFSTISFDQQRSRRSLVITPENSVSSPLPTERSLSRSWMLTENLCSSSSSDNIPASCCSSNGSSEVVETERIKFVDLEEMAVLQDENSEVEASMYNRDRERRSESTPSSRLQLESADLDSPARLETEANSRLRSPMADQKIPTESELEEFFAAAEKDMIQKSFAEKYNYDIVQDVPLEGRYEWVRLKP